MPGRVNHQARFLFHSAAFRETFLNDLGQPMLVNTGSFRSISRNREAGDSREVFSSAEYEVSRESRTRRSVCVNPALKLLPRTNEYRITGHERMLLRRLRSSRKAMRLFAFGMMRIKVQ